MTGPKNAVVGDSDQPMSMPETQVDEEQLLEEKKLAKYSQTAEFKRLKDFLEARIKFYQNFLPDGQSVVDSKKELSELGQDWKVANAIVGEFQRVLAEYERAKEVVDAREKSS